MSGKIPTNVQAGQYGSVNNAGRRRARPQPIVLLQGAAQGLEHSANREINSLQQKANDATKAARANPLSACNFIQGLTFANGVPLTVKHGLGRTFSSCLLAGQSAAGSIAVQRASTPTRPLSVQNLLDERQIVITPNFSGNADLLVW